MARLAVRIPLILLPVAMLGAGCVPAQKHEMALKAQATAEARAREFAERVRYLEAERGRMVSGYEQTIEQLQHQAQELAQTRPAIDWESFGVSSEAADGALQLAGDLTFLSGRHDLTDKGKAELEKVATALKTAGATLVRVEGHTDSDPIKASSGRYKDNLHLSVMRAHAVADFLVAQGVDAKVVSIAGFGASRPRSEKKADNRRVEIRALNEQSDAAEVAVR